MKRLWLALLVACGPPAKAPPPPTPLHLDRACDLVPSAGLTWILELKPRAIAAEPDLIPAISKVVPEARFVAFAAAHGGVDVRQIQDLCVARFKGTTLSVSHSPFDPAKVERAFSDRATITAGRAVDVQNPPVVRLWGEAGGAEQHAVLFGSEAIAIEEGKGLGTKTAEAFALGKLKKAQPALKGAALAHVSDLVGDAPVRAFAPGPFDGELAQGLGGLLRASTAIGFSVKPLGAKLVVRMVLAGAWNDDANAASERLAAAVHVISETGLGHLLGLSKPIAEPKVTGREDALIVEAAYDADLLATGFHDALDAEVSEIFHP